MPRISFKSYVASLDAEKLSKLKYIEDGRYHYVYRITNVVEGKHYYGSRTSSVSPELDLGIVYFTSSLTNSWIIEDQKQHPDNYRYKIIRSNFKTRTDAIIYESYLHSLFDVKNHEKFYNGSNQTPYGFDTTGNESISKRISLIRNDISWKQTIGQEAKKKECITKSSCEWKADFSKTMIKAIFDNRQSYAYGYVKQSNTKNSEIWKETIGKEMQEKRITKMKIIGDDGITTFKRSGIKSSKTQRVNGKNSKELNPSAKIISIYDNESNLICICHGNFKDMCKQYGLPFNALKQSYQNGGCKIYTDVGNNLKRLMNTGYIKFSGYYAKIEDERE